MLQISKKIQNGPQFGAVDVRFDDTLGLAQSISAPAGAIASISSTGVITFSAGWVEITQAAYDAYLASIVAANAAAATAATNAYNALSPANGQAMYVPDRAALAALDVTKTKVAIVYNEGGRNGIFIFSTANLSTLVTNDTTQGVYVAPTSGPTGAAGAWVRQNDGSMSAAWFGLSPTASRAANATALTAAINFVKDKLGKLRIPAGAYSMNPVSATLAGAGNTLHVVGDGWGKTELRWNGTDGIALTLSAARTWAVGDATNTSFEKCAFIQESTTTNVGKALAMDGTLGTNNGFNSPVLINECMFRSTSVTGEWAKGLEFTSMNSVNIRQSFFYGARSAQKMICVEHIASLNHDASPSHMTSCEAYFFDTVVKAGDYVEGIHVTDCDFVVGKYGVDWATTSSEAQLCCIGTHMNTGVRCIRLNNVQASQIIGCLLWATAGGDGGTVIELSDSSDNTISGNEMIATGVGTACVLVNSPTWPVGFYGTRKSTITGNIMRGSEAGVILGANVRGYVVDGNVYQVTGDTVGGIGNREVVDTSNSNLVTWSRRKAFTPVLQGQTTPGVGTYGLQRGWVHRKGDIIDFELTMTWSDHTGTGPMVIPLPDAPSGNNGVGSACSLYLSGAAFVFTGAPLCHIDANTALIRLRQAASGAVPGTINIVAGASGSLYVSGRYPIGERGDG